VVGVGGLVDARVLGVGYETVQTVLNGEVVGAALLGLIIAKSLVWAAALGSGTSGGVLAPLLMIGGAVGALLGTLASVGEAGLWAMVGMAAMMGGTMGAPLTAVVFLLELTHDFQVLPALLAGSVGALCVTVLILRRSILTEKHARRGQHVTREYSVNIFEVMRVDEVMDRELPVVAAETTVAALAVQIAQPGSALARRMATFIAENGKLVGIVTRGDLLRAQLAGDADSTPVSRVGTASLVTVFADETLSDAVEKMLHHTVSRLPVVSRSEPRRIVGYLGRAEILTAHRMRQVEERQRGKGLLRFRVVAGPCV